MERDLLRVLGLDGDLVPVLDLLRVLLEDGVLVGEGVSSGLPAKKTPRIEVPSMATASLVTVGTVGAVLMRKSLVEEVAYTMKEPNSTRPARERTGAAASTVMVLTNAHFPRVGEYLRTTPLSPDVLSTATNKVDVSLKTKDQGL